MKYIDFIHGYYVYQKTNNFGDQIITATKGYGDWIDLVYNHEGNWITKKEIVAKIKRTLK